MLQSINTIYTCLQPSFTHPFTPTQASIQSSIYSSNQTCIHPCNNHPSHACNNQSSTHPGVHPPILTSTHPSWCPPTHLGVHPPILASIYPSWRPSTHPDFHPLILASIHPSWRPFVYPCIYPPMPAPSTSPASIPNSEVVPLSQFPR